MNKYFKQYSAQRIAACFVVIGLMLAPAVKAESADPLEGLNKVTQSFNDKADALILKPIATGYSKVLPNPVKRGVGNFFSNLGDVNNSVNNLLQGKPADSFTDLLRLIINSTIGVGGLFDPATKLGLEKHQETFGQTLSVWGVPKGPYLVIPLLGPSTLTDALTRPVDTLLDPVRYLYPVDHRNVLYGTRAVDDRESLLSAEAVVFGDRYVFFREAYLQRRDYLVNDGEVEDEFDDF